MQFLAFSLSSLNFTFAYALVIVPVGHAERSVIEIMAKANIIYQEKTEIYAKYYQRGSDDFLEYKAIIQIKDSGKLPIVMEIKFDGMEPSFAPMPPEEHVFRAKDLIDLFLKINRWFNKYGYLIK